MERKDDTIIFDSPEQHRVFLGTITALEGGELFVSAVLQELGRSKRYASGWWKRIEEVAKLKDGESVAYDWVKQQLVVTKNDSMVYEKNKALEALREILANYSRGASYIIDMASWGLGEKERKPV